MTVLAKQAETQVFERLADLSEDDFRDQFVVPLFRRCGYQVEVLHGSTERGVDLIMRHSMPPLGEQLTVAQVKARGWSANYNSEDQFPAVTQQLRAAARREFPGPNGAQEPSCVLLISSTTVAERVLDCCRELLRDMPATFRVVQPRDLVRMLSEHAPDLLDDLTAAGYHVGLGALEKSRTDVVRHALGDKDAEDLSFISVRVGLESDQVKSPVALAFEGTVRSQPIDQQQWDRLRSADVRVQEMFGVGLLPKQGVTDSSWSELHTRVARARGDVGTLGKDLTSHTASYNRLLEDLETFAISEVRAADSRRDLAEAAPDLDKMLDYLREAATRMRRAWASDVDDGGSEAVAEERESVRSRLGTWLRGVRACSLVRSKGDFSTELKSRVERLVERCVDLAERDMKLADLRALEEHGRLRVQVDARPAAEVASKRAQSMLPCGGRSLRRGDLEKLFGVSEALSSVDGILAELGFGAVLQPAGGARPGRTALRAPLLDCLGTGRNFSVLGGAGMGKTTGLKAYARAVLDSGGVALYAPLPAVMAKLERGAPQGDRLIAAVLQCSGVAAPGECLPLARRISGQRIVLCLDSIDEGYAVSRDVLKEVMYASSRRTAVQFVLSSRTSGDYVDDIPFIPITLVPWSDMEVRRFLVERLGAGEDARCVRKHLDRHPAIREVTRNPLSLTILCHLARNHVPLPQSEAKLYEKRFEFLAGGLDPYKHIRRLRTEPSLLRDVAQALARRLHEERGRWAKLEDLQRWACSEVGLWPRDRVLASIDDLRDPCEILVANGERWGFGHLRFQEHLASMQLERMNRGRLCDLLDDPWWSDVFVLHAQASPSIDWLINSVVTAGSAASAPDLLARIIEVRPPEERERLRRRVQIAASAERLGRRAGGGLGWGRRPALTEDAVWPRDDELDEIRGTGQGFR